MVIRVGYFCSSGHTEAGGIHQFLKNLRPDIEWSRCFPATDKPGPKHRKDQKKVEPSGTTGATLIDRMIERLKMYHRGSDCEFDHVLLIDDADCRFLDAAGELKNRLDRLSEEIREITGRPALRFIALWASPEVEAWFLADWEEGFGREYRTIAHPLRALLQTQKYLGPVPWSALETYGGPYVAKSACCTKKLSDEVIQQGFSELAKNQFNALPSNDGEDIDRKSFEYSKKVHGPRMLRRVRADKIALVCTQHFKPGYVALCTLTEVPPAAMPQPGTTALPQSPPKRRKRET